jgi:hypothetical protein
MRRAGVETLGVKNSLSDGFNRRVLHREQLFALRWGQAKAQPGTLVVEYEGQLHARQCCTRGRSPRPTGAVGLEPADLARAVTGDGGDQFAVLVDDPHAGVAEFDGDGLAGVAEADLDALTGDLHAAAAGDSPLDRQARLRQGVWPGEADALEFVPLAGRDGAGQGAPQDAVLGDDVHDLSVEADCRSLSGQRGADLAGSAGAQPELLRAEASRAGA